MFGERRRFKAEQAFGSIRNGRRRRPRFNLSALEGLEVRCLLTSTTLSVGGASGTYGGTTDLLAVLSTGGVPIAGEIVDFQLGGTELGTMTTDSNGLAEIDNLSLAGLNAGTYIGDVTAEFVGDAGAGFTASSGSNDLTVTPAPLTITANNQSKVYGAALPTLNASYTGLVNGDTSASLTTAPTITTTATAASHVAGSPYAITASGAVDPNYTISYVDGTLSVTTAPLTITANNQSKVYGAALPTLNASYTGLVNGDTSASLTTAPTIITTATAASHVAGSPYAITASGAVDTDYTISYVDGTLSVTTAPLTITANNQSKVYGAALPTLNASYTGLVNGDTSASLTTAPTIITTATAASHVAGSPYAITASGAVDNDYTISYVPGTLAVTTAPLTITADNQSNVYGAALPTLTASYTGFVNGDTAANLSTSPTIMTAATAASHVAGSPYFIIPSAAADPDYTISYVPGALAVTPAPLTITADNQSNVYGAALPALTASYNGFVNGDTAASLSTPPTITTTATATSPVAGSPYAITASGEVDPDYTISDVPGSLTVTPAPLTIVASNLSKVYGQANPTLTGTVTGILNGDDVVANFTTTASQSSDVVPGGYPITFTGLAGSMAANYSTTVAGGSVTPGTLTITPAPLTVVVNSASRVYGQANPPLNGVVTGVLNGDDVTAQYATTATTSSNVVSGGYPITVAGLSGTKAGDYSISTSTPGTLTITPALLTIRASTLSKVYGQPNPAFTVSYQGFVLGQNPSVLSGPLGFSTPATVSSPVGLFPVTPSGSTSSNYAISYIPGALSVTPATLIVKANNVTTTYARLMPPLTATYSGFVTGDTPASLTTPVRLTTTAKASSPVGTYAITASGGSAKNYTIVHEPGVLTIQPYPGPTAFVTTLYKLMLGRAPEPTGLSSWLAQIARGESESNVAKQIYNSAEARLARAFRKVPPISEATAYAVALQAQGSV